MSQVGYLIAQGFSWATTGLAIFPHLRAQAQIYVGGGHAADGTALMLAVLATSLIQFSLTLAWERFFGDPLGAWSAAVFGLLLSFTSGALAAASWTAWTDSTGLQRHLTLRSTQASTQPLLAFSANLAEIAVEMASLSAMAERKAELEERQGGTCLGDPKVRDCGMKCRLRQSQSKLFKRQSEAATVLSETSADLAFRISPQSSNEEMSSAYRKARRLSIAPARLEMAQALDQQHHGLTSGWTDPASGKSFQCRDPDMLAAVAKLKGLLAEPVEFPMELPRQAEIDFLDTVESSAGKIAAILSALLEGDWNGLPDDGTSSFGLVVAFAIEALIVWLISTHQKDLRASGRNRGSIWEFLEDGKPVPEKHEPYYRGLLETLRYFTIRARGRDFLAVPIDGDPALCARIAEAAQQLDLKPDRLMGDSIDLGSIEPTWVAARDGLHGGARHFQMYVVGRRVREWQRKMLRNLRKFTE